MPHADAARRNPTATLAVLSLGLLAYSLSQTMIAPAMPDIQRALGVTTGAVAWTLTAYLVSASIMTAVVGRLGDMFGKKRLLVVTLVAFGVGSAICALAPSIEVLVAGRVVQGAAGGLFPLAFGIIRDEFPREKVAGGIGIVSSLLGVGSGLGLIIGGLLVDHTSWHWIFWLGLALTVVAVVATILVVPESPIRSPGRVDWWGAVLLGVGLAAPLIGVSQGASWGWTSPKTAGLVLGGLAVLGLFAWFELRQREPLVNIRTLGLRPVLLTNVATVFVGFAMFSGFVLIPQLAQLPESTGFGLGATATVAGLLMLPSTLMMLVGAPLSGRMAGRHGSKRPLVVGALLTGLSLLLFAVSHGSMAGIVLWGVVQGLGIGFAFAAMPNLIIEVVPQKQTGEATAVNTLLRNVGSAIGSQIAGTLLASGVLASTGAPSDGSFTLAFALGGAMALIAALIAITIPRAKRAAASRGDGDRGGTPGGAAPGGGAPVADGNRSAAARERSLAGVER